MKLYLKICIFLFVFNLYGLEDNIINCQPQPQSVDMKERYIKAAGACFCPCATCVAFPCVCIKSCKVDVEKTIQQVHEEKYGITVCCLCVFCPCASSMICERSAKQICKNSEECSRRCYTNGFGSKACCALCNVNYYYGSAFFNDEPVN